MNAVRLKKENKTPRNTFGVVEAGNTAGKSLRVERNKKKLFVRY